MLPSARSRLGSTPPSTLARLPTPAMRALLALYLGLAALGYLAVAMRGDDFVDQEHGTIADLDVGKSKGLHRADSGAVTAANSSAADKRANCIKLQHIAVSCVGGMLCQYGKCCICEQAQNPASTARTGSNTCAARAKGSWVARNAPKFGAPRTHTVPSRENAT